MAGKGFRGVAVGFRTNQWDESKLWENIRKEKERKEQEKNNLHESLKAPDNDKVNQELYG